MKELFSEAIRVDNCKSVSVNELPDNSLGIKGLTIGADGDVASGTLRLSKDESEILRQILNRWHKVKGA